MASEENIRPDDNFFLNEDKTLTFGAVLDSDGAGVNISGWALSWMLKRLITDSDSDAVITKTTSSGIAITGSYNSTLASNTQRAVVTIADTDTSSLSAGIYHHELKRTDAGLETVLSFGTARLKRGVHQG